MQVLCPYIPLATLIFFLTQQGKILFFFFEAHRLQEMTMVDLKGHADLIVEFCTNLSLKMTGSFISNF